MPGLQRTLARSEATLLSLLVIEVAVFAAIGERFFTAGNLLELLRSSVELGLLAVALTPILITGGIDLSVGAVLGLSAVVFGAAVRDWQIPAGAAAAIALGVGLAGGSLNALLITRLRLPPLIVTLGSLSLFRGVADAMTQGAVNYSGFSPRFLALGQAYVWGAIPAQLPVLVAALAGYGMLLHRSTIGRALYAVGWTASGARYAGIPVERRVGLVYVLSGVMASVAAVIYVAHLGQAKSDAGAGYELDAITAVVLGGTSVFGGRGTLGGTILGLFLLAVLKNGLQLAALPTEFTGVLTGALLVASIAIDVWRRRPRSRAPAAQRAHAATSSQATFSNQEVMDVKNRQLAILCGAILLGAAVTSGTNVWLVRSLERSAARAAPAAAVPATGSRVVIAMMPKAKGDPYFVSCQAGAEEAARELGVELLWDGPTGLDAARQNEMVENWITRGVSAIAVAVENQASMSTVLRKARARGIAVLTWDADAEPDARAFFVNQATPEGIGNTLTDEAARLLGGKGDFAVITGALSAANQNAWIAAIRKRLADRYPGLTLATIRPSDDDRDKAFAETQTIMRVFPKVRLVMAISAPAVPGAAEAVQQAGRTDLNVIGLSLPNMNKPYVHNGVVQTVVLWNTRDLGYLTVYAAAQAAQHVLGDRATSMQAGRLGTIEIRGSQILLGEPVRFTKANIDKFDF
jgi:rhamnose transport system permease protein